jgi:ribose/xylose/arabinose/galactoside ABC-type transport system permease subunit
MGANPEGADPTVGDAGENHATRTHIARVIARLAVGEASALLLAAVFFLAVWPFVPEIAASRTLSNLLVNMLPLLAVALGETVVLIAGGIDLSVTSIIAACSVVSAWVMTGGGQSSSRPAAILPAIVAALATGGAIGLVNGVSIAALKMPPFLVTLSTTTIVGGATLWATHSRNIADLPDAFTDIGFGSLLGIPDFAWIVGVLAIVIHLVLSRTLLGRWLYAIGHAPRVAEISGVPVGRVTASAYVISGLCAAVAALLYTARLETGSPTMGRELLLDVVGATVIGGTSLFGGKGKVLWTVFGVLLFSLIDNTLNLIGLEYYTIMTVKGLVILGAAGIDLLRVRLLAGA